MNDIVRVRLPVTRGSSAWPMQLPAPRPPTPYMADGSRKLQDGQVITLNNLIFSPVFTPATVPIIHRRDIPFDNGSVYQAHGNQSAVVSLRQDKIYAQREEKQYQGNVWTLTQLNLTTNIQTNPCNIVYSDRKLDKGSIIQNNPSFSPLQPITPKVFVQVQEYKSERGSVQSFIGPNDSTKFNSVKIVKGDVKFDSGSVYTHGINNFNILVPTKQNYIIQQEYRQQYQGSVYTSKIYSSVPSLRQGQVAGTWVIQAVSRTWSIGTYTRSWNINSIDRTWLIP